MDRTDCAFVSVVVFGDLILSLLPDLFHLTTVQLLKKCTAKNSRKGWCKEQMCSFPGDSFLLPPTSCFLSLYFQKWWTPSQTVRLRRRCPSWLNTARTYGASWRPCLSRTGLSWWSGSLSWPTSESSTRCWFSSPSRTSWWSYWTCTGWLLYARTTDPPAVEPTRAALSYEFDKSAQGQ